MAETDDRVFHDALSLPAEARVSLVAKLLASLNLPTQAEVDRQWAEEAERRVAEIEHGDVQVAAAETVFAQIRGKHGR